MLKQHGYIPHSRSPARGGAHLAGTHVVGQYRTHSKHTTLHEDALMRWSISEIYTAAKGFPNGLLSAQALRRYRRTRLEKTIRQRCQFCYLGTDVVVGRVLGKYKMFLGAEDISLTPHLLLDGFWELWITQALARFIRPGMVAVDVGANVGYYTLLLADLVGERGKVWACEPNPTIFPLLAANVEVNGFAARTHTVNKAIADTEGQEVRLYIPKHHYGGSSIIAPPEPDTAPTTVQTATLDSLLYTDVPVDFIKIDVEGAERLVWEGMLQTIRSSEKIAIALEFDARRYADADKFLHAIVKENFQLRHIDYDSKIKNISAEQVLEGQAWWMLFLQRH